MENEIKNEQQITSNEELNDILNELSKREQVYSIALFDILGFSNYVEANGTDDILKLYEKLLDLVKKQKSSYNGPSEIAGDITLAPISPDWKNAAFVANANGYVNVCHFSDTFIIYVNYNIGKQPFWLRDTKYEPYPLLLGESNTECYPILYEKHHIYLSFLQTCMDFFCQAIISGIPLRGCIATGTAIMDTEKSILFGKPIVEAARGETERDAIGICFGKSFKNSHPVYNDYFIPYFSNIKNYSKDSYISPMMLDWGRYWRTSSNFKNYKLSDCINKMNRNTKFSKYYDNAIQFYNFSEQHQSWFEEINRDNITNIIDYYNEIEKWYNSL